MMMRRLLTRSSSVTTRRTPLLSNLQFRTSQQQQQQQQQQRTFAQLDFVDADQGAIDDSIRSLVAERRSADGTRFCNKLRIDGYVPGIVYGKDQSGRDRKLLVQMPQNQLQRELNRVGRALQNTLYNLKVDEEEFVVIPRDVQAHPTKEMPICVNYLCHDPTRKMKLKIPLEFYNLEKCTGLKQGGRLEIAQRDVDCWFQGEAIPRNVRVNMKGYSIGERVRMNQIEYPEGVKPLRPADMMFKITGRRGVKVEMVEGEDGEEVPA